MDAQRYLNEKSQKAYASYMELIANPDMPTWDYVIITASNAQQARGFEKQLASRRQAGFLPVQTHYGIVPDPVGERVGNGGAMLGALRYVAQHANTTTFVNLRIMVILSSGDSKRIPQYSAMGKVFSPVPKALPNGHASTLFDEMMMQTAVISKNMPAGMFICAGDVLLLFDASQLTYTAEHAMAISFLTEARKGQNHGVFIEGNNQNIADVWHKQSVCTLNRLGAINQQGKVNIDTGAMIFFPPVLETLYGLINTETSFRNYVNGHLAPSLYVDFFYPLVENATLEKYLEKTPEGVLSDDLIDCRRKLWKVLRPYRVALKAMEPAKFIHFGTTQEMLQLMTEHIGHYAYLGWASQVNSQCQQAQLAAYSSQIAPAVTVGKGCYVEYSTLLEGTLGDNSMLSCIALAGEMVPSNVVIHGQKLKNNLYTARIWGVNDNPKATLEQNATLFDVSLQCFLDRTDQTVEDLFHKEEAHTLWHARLFPMCEDEKTALSHALNLYQLQKGQGNLDMWKNMPKTSLHDSFENAV